MNTRFWDLCSKPSDTGKISEALGPTCVYKEGLNQIFLAPDSPGDAVIPLSLPQGWGACCRLWGRITRVAQESGARRDCPLGCGALPLLKVVSARLDILRLQHEPCIFQDCLAHLERPHTKGQGHCDVFLLQMVPRTGHRGPGTLRALSHGKYF